MSGIYIMREQGAGQKFMREQGREHRSQEMTVIIEEIVPSEEKIKKRGKRKE